MIDPLADEGLRELAPGVMGYTFDTDGGLYIPVINAQDPGSGQVAAYLDSLPRDRRVVFPNVLHPRLEEMLQRRGFTLTWEWAEDFDEWVDVYERGPS